MNEREQFPLGSQQQLRLQSLLDAVLSAQLTDEQAAELESVLTESDAAREFAVGYLHLDALLARYECGSKAPILPTAEVQIVAPNAVRPRAVAPAARPVLGLLLQAVRRVPGGELTVGMLVVAVVGIAFWGLYRTIQFPLRNQAQQPAIAQEHRQPAVQVAPVATIVDESTVRWTDGEPPLGRNRRVRPGESLEIASGTLDIQLRQGAFIQIEGPAHWTINGNNSASLTAGKLIASVPPHAIGFTVETPSGRVVDLGTEFFVNVGPDGSSEVQVLKGEVEVHHAKAQTSDPLPQLVTAGNAVRLDQRRSSIESIAFDVAAIPAEMRLAAERKPSFAGRIPLGNLFDDRPPFSLAEAVVSDTWSAVPDCDHLGIDLVFAGGAAVKEIAPGIRFDFVPLGWLGKAYSQPLNDAVCLEHAAPASPIRTAGQALTSGTGKLEDGIGMHADGVVTFDLDEIRAAGGLDGRPLRFRCDRAGLSDDAVGKGMGTVHCVAIYTDASQVLATYVNGAPHDFHLADGVFVPADVTGTPLKADGQFAQFDLDLPGSARFLTLAVTAAGDDIGFDHGVWSNCVLEPANELTATSR